MRELAALALALHLCWIGWVIFGAYWTRGHPLLTIFHVASLAWGIIVELSSLPCPMTLAEQFIETQAGISPYAGGFVVHYLDRIVYPDIPESVLVWIGVAVCAANLSIYSWRLWRFIWGRGVQGFRHPADRIRRSGHSSESCR